MIIEILSTSAVVAIVVAFKKHQTLSAVLASAKREASNIETLAVGISAEIESKVKADVLAVAARLKAL